MRTRTTAIVFAALLVGALPARAALTAQPASLGFPDTGTGSTSAMQGITFTNTGNAGITVNNITLTGADPNDYVLSNLPGLPLALLPGVGFSVGVAFAPTTIGTRTANVDVAVANMPSVDVPLTGKGIGPKATVTPSPIVVGEQPFGQAQPPLTVTVSNTGGAQLHVSSVTLTGPDAARFTMSGLPGFPTTLGPNASFAFTLTFTPTQAGQANATLTVNSDDPMNPTLATPVSGLAGNPVVSVDLGTIIFGNVRVMQSSAAATVDITNTGFSDLHVQTITVSGANAGDFSLSMLPALPATLHVGQSASFAVTFSPTAAGARSAKVVIANDDPNAPMKAIPLSGTGTLPNASVSPNKLDFGNVLIGQTGGANFTITNTGTGPVNVTTLNISGPNAALFTANKKAPFTIAAMGSSVVQVSFAPTTIGSFTATLSFTTDDPNLMSASLPMTGMGISPVFTANPLSVDFGDVVLGDSAAPQTITISNTGNSPLTISMFDVTGPDLADFPIMNMPAVPVTLMPNGSLAFSVGFKPTTDGVEQAKINLATDDPNRTKAVIAVDGYGRQPAVLATPPMLDFGSVIVGNTSQTFTVTVQNIGDADLHITGARLTGAMAGSFSATPLDSMTLASNKAYKINLTFTPQMAAMFAATLEIDSSDAGVMPATVALTGTGVSPMVSASPMSIDFGPIVVGMTSAAQTVTIRNSGKNLVVLDKITSTDPQFGPPVMGLSTQISPNGGTLDLPLSFTPTTAGDFKGQVQFWLSGATLPAAGIMVSGSGVAGGGSRGGGCALSGGALSSTGILLSLVALAALLRRRRR